AQQWAVADLETLLARPADGSPPTGVDRAITFLAAASTPGRHPDVAPHLEALLLADPRLAVDAGGAALTALTHLDHEVLAEIAEEALRLLGAADPTEDRSAHLVGPLVVLGIVALSAGDHERALDLFTQAAEHAPRADEGHGLGGVAKAAALIGLGNALSVGDR